MFSSRKGVSERYKPIKTLREIKGAACIRSSCELQQRGRLSRRQSAVGSLTPSFSAFSHRRAHVRRSSACSGVSDGAADFCFGDMRGPRFRQGDRPRKLPLSAGEELFEPAGRQTVSEREKSCAPGLLLVK